MPVADDQVTGLFVELVLQGQSLAIQDTQLSTGSSAEVADAKERLKIVSRCH